MAKGWVIITAENVNTTRMPPHSPPPTTHHNTTAGDLVEDVIDDDTKGYEGEGKGPTRGSKRSRDVATKGAAEKTEGHKQNDRVIKRVQGQQLRATSSKEGSKGAPAKLRELHQRRKSRAPRLIRDGIGQVR